MCFYTPYRDFNPCVMFILFLLKKTSKKAYKMCEKTCRVCLNINLPLLSLFDYQGQEQYYKKIMFCTKIEIAENDGFPGVICQICASNLSISYDFIKKCHESDKSLRNDFKIELGEICIKEESVFSHEEDQEFDKYSPNDGDFEIETKKLKTKPSKLKLKKHNKHFMCSECGMRVSSKAALIIHMRKHNGEKPYCCSHCPMKFSQSGTLKVHIERRHSKEPRHLRERPFSCDTCGGNFFSNRDLTVHMRRHTGDHPFSCETCNQRFTQVGSLIRHRRIHTGEKPYQCKLCQKSFIDKNLLNKHQFVHSNEKRFMCSLCGKAVKTKSSLGKHLQLHREKNPVICEICGVARSSPGNLNAHIKKYHSEKSGQCEICNKQFWDLQAHMRKHTGENIFTCAVCGREFPSKISLAVHMQKHTRPSKLQCSQSDCLQKFSKKADLEAHMLKLHANILQIPHLTKLKNTEEFSTR